MALTSRTRLILERSLLIIAGVLLGLAVLAGQRPYSRPLLWAGISLAAAHWIIPKVRHPRGGRRSLRLPALLFAIGLIYLMNGLDEPLSSLLMVPSVVVVLLVLLVEQLLYGKGPLQGMRQELSRRRGWATAEAKGETVAVWTGRKSRLRITCSPNNERLPFIQLTLKGMSPQLSISSAVAGAAALETGDPSLDGAARLEGDEAVAHALVARAGTSVADLLKANGSLSKGKLVAQVAVTESANELLRQAAWLLRIARAVRLAEKRTAAGLLQGVKGRYALPFRRRCFELLESRFPEAAETTAARALTEVDPLLKGGDPGRLSLATPAGEAGAVSFAEREGALSMARKGETSG